MMVYILLSCGEQSGDVIGVYSTPLKAATASEWLEDHWDDHPYTEWYTDMRELDGAYLGKDESQQEEATG